MDALGEAAEKLDTVRALMSTRGSHAVPKKKVQELKSAVAKDGARLTSHGLVPVSYTHLTLPTILLV